MDSKAASESGLARAEAPLGARNSQRQPELSCPKGRDTCDACARRALQPSGFEQMLCESRTERAPEMILAFTPIEARAGEFAA